MTSVRPHLSLWATRAARAAATAVRSPEAGLLLMLAVLPLDVAGRIITEPVTVTWFHVALLFTLVSWAVAWRTGRFRVRHRVSPVTIGVALLIVSAVWSLPGSLAPDTTAVSAVRLLFLGLFYAAFVALTPGESTAKRLVTVLVVTAAASALLAMVQHVFPGLGFAPLRSSVQIGMRVFFRSRAFFGDPNYLGTFLSVAIIVALGMAVYARRLRAAVPWLVAAGICAVGLQLTFSRSGWVGAILGAVVILLTVAFRNRRATIIALVALVLLTAVLALSGTLSRFQSMTDVDNDIRYLQIGSTIEMIHDNWLFGTGLGAFDRAYPLYRQAGSVDTITKPHELPLALWAEMGLPALFAELTIVGGLAWTLWRRRRKRWNPYLAIGVAAFLAVLAQSLFQYYLYFEYLWFSLALAVAAARFKESPAEVVQ
ncbi:MAG: O-antigen ligase family protein [Coriobacteriia bacterium]|nr:O-antigen ligase family protein [Coriobacteriia bacterium]